MVGGGQTMRAIYAEVNMLVPLVTEWVKVPTSGSAVCVYANGGATRTYKVKSQWTNVGNLVHELTHIAVNEAFGRDFINYRNVRLGNVPDRVYTASGFAANEADRQMKFMKEEENVKIQAIISKLKTMARVSPKKGGMQAEATTDVQSKLDYAFGMPQTEFHTCINQILVWLTEWGYPSIGHKKGKEPAANLFYYEIEKVAAKNWWERVQGYQARLAA
jgi:hypothetical protein